MADPVVYKMKPLLVTPAALSTSSMYKLKNLLKSPTDKQNVTPLQEKSEIRVQNEEKILSRQEKLLSNLKILQDQISAFRIRIDELKTPKTVAKEMDALSLFAKAGVRDFVVSADPQYPPYSLLWLPKLWNLPMNVSVHIHSSISSLPTSLTAFNKIETKTPDPTHINMTFVWKDVGSDAQLIVSPVKGKTVRGEVNILRFFDYILNPEASNRTRSDEILDMAHRLSYASNRDEPAIYVQLQKYLGNDNWFLQSQTPTIADIAVWSALKKVKRQSTLPPVLYRWMSLCSEFLGEDVATQA